MEALGLASLIAFAIKLIDFLKFLRAKDWNAVATQAAVWAAGVITVMLAAVSDILKDLMVFGHAIGTINLASQVFVGMTLLSLGSAVYDFKKAIDQSDSAKTPSLLPPKT